VHINATYAYFCDDNGLPRIYATPEQRRRNYLLLALAAIREAFK